MLLAYKRVVGWFAKCSIADKFEIVVFSPNIKAFYQMISCLKDRSLFTGRGWPEIWGATFLASRRWGALIVGAKIFEKASETLYHAFQAKITLKKSFEKNIPRGALIFGSFENQNLWPLLPINSEPPLNDSS